MLKRTIIGTACLTFTHFLPASAAELGATDEPIKLAINEWTGQHVTTHIIGEVLERAGYKVEYTTAGYFNMYQPMGEGEIHAALEVWSSNVVDQFYEEEKAGRVVDVSDLGLAAREGFAYPKHVEDICPGLPAWEALKDCASEFATPETLPKGRLLDYPADWGTPGKDRIVEGLQLPFKAVPAGSEGALISELRAATEKKSPLLMTFWQPHWAVGRYDVKFVELPKPEEACYEDPSWGTNPGNTHDCDFLPTRIFKVAWSGFKDKWPAAYEIIKEFKLTVEEQQPLMGKVDVDGQPVEKVAQEWVESNPDKWQGLMASATE